MRCRDIDKIFFIDSPQCRDIDNATSQHCVDVATLKMLCRNIAQDF